MWFWALFSLSIRFLSICSVESTSQYLNNFVSLFLWQISKPGETAEDATSARIGWCSKQHTLDQDKTLTYLSAKVQQLATELAYILSKWSKRVTNILFKTGRSINCILIRVFSLVFEHSLANFQCPLGRN